VRFVLVLVFASGCIIPFVTPPLKGEIGGATRIGRATRVDEMEQRGEGSSLHAAAGTHLASGTMTDRQKFDVGAGWTFEKTKDTTSNGVYLDTSWFIDRASFSRTSVGTRGEVRWLGDGAKAYAAKLRIDAELFSAGANKFDSEDKCGSSSGTHYGTTAIGVFVEAGRVWAPEMSGGDAWVATAGITLRLPSSVGVWVGIPWCK
jgi:hypothetical protein